ncbi:hypothetical protein [Helicobacter canis]|uniref:Uncharacterized protein n=1 Tax=Helicobacter canis TaxID=29419 RepID=A0A5M9QWI7_9HELI|nr:hypothetical protein [Helicobacter canis]KAA8711455.1 hypothetical protein F4V45_00280 [Helicobacter canis]
MGSRGRVGFWAKNGDCCGDSAVTYALVCALESPCKTRDTARRRRCFFSKAPFLSQKSCREQTALKNSQILESQIESKKQQAYREQIGLESKRLDSSTAQNLKPAKPSCLKIQSIQSGLDASF